MAEAMEQAEHDAVDRQALIQRWQNWHAKVLPHVLALSGNATMYGRTEQELAGFTRYRAELTISLNELEYETELLGHDFERAKAILSEQERRNRPAGSIRRDVTPLNEETLADFSAQFRALKVRQDALTSERDRVDAELVVLRRRKIA